jgi:8-hydroxy-5-deazaflavin:NADPH oxidoreductase
LSYLKTIEHEDFCIVHIEFLMFKIAIIGAGNVGAALGKGWLNAGKDVVFGVRDSQSPKTQKVLTIIPEAKVKSISEAAFDAEVIVITTPPEAILELLPHLGDLTKKVVIDTTNSVKARPEPFATAYHAIKEIAKAEDVVKCFNSTGFENMLNPTYQENGIDMFAAGNSKKAKQVAEQLAKEIGFATCYDFGGDDKVELLEKFALSWINLAILQGYGRNLAFKLLKR